MPVIYCKPVQQILLFAANISSCLPAYVLRTDTGVYGHSILLLCATSLAKPSRQSQCMLTIYYIEVTLVEQRTIPPISVLEIFALIKMCNECLHIVRQVG